MAGENEIQDAPLAPPIDSRPDDDVGDAALDTPADEPGTVEPKADEPAPEPGSAREAVQAALDKAAGKDEPPAADVPPAKPGDAAPPPAPDAEAARLAALYTIPKGITGEPRARYKALADHAQALETQHREATTAAAAVKERLGGFEAVLNDAGATAEILGGHLTYIKQINSGDLEGALAWIEGERAAIAKALGKTLDGVDLLDDFPDLRERVDAMRLTEEDALEMAKLRREQAGANARQADADKQLQAQRAQDEVAAKRNEALGEIDAFLKDRQANDLDFKHKEAAVTKWWENGGEDLMKTAPPDKWLKALKSVYDSVTVAPTPPPRRNTTPLRPGGTGGDTKGEPKSPEEAVYRALGLG